MKNSSYKKSNVTGTALIIFVAINCTIFLCRDAIPMQEKRNPIPLGPPEETSLFVAFSDRGDILYSSRLLQLGGFDTNGKSIRHLQLVGFNALHTMFFPNGKHWLASSGDECDLRDGVSGKILKNVKAKGGRIVAMSTEEKGDYFVLVTEKSVELYRTADCSRLTSFNSNATRASIPFDATFIIAVDKEGHVEKMIVRSGKIECIRTITIKDVPGVASVIISPDGKLAYIGTYDGNIWSLNTSDLSTAYTIDMGASVTCLKCNLDGQTLAVGTEGPDFSIFNAKGKKVIPRQDKIPSAPASFAFSSDSTTLAIGYWNGECGVYSAGDGARKWTSLVKRE